MRDTEKEKGLKMQWMTGYKSRREKDWKGKG